MREKKQRKFKMRRSDKKLSWKQLILFKRILSILTAAALACSISGCAKSPQKIYAEAQKLLADGNYGKAAEQFEKVTSISDAPKYALYAKALQEAEDGNYSDAFTTLESLGDFADSSMYISYLKARQALESGGVQDLLHAREIYEDIPLFKDSKEQIRMIDDRIIELIGTNPVGVAEEGGLVPLGEYDSQEIVWRVLSVKDGKALLLSENAVAQMQYDFDKENPNSDEYKGWDKCSLRDWLNGEFLQEAFSEEERSLIMQTQLNNNIFEEYERFDADEQRTISRVLTAIDEGVNYPDGVKEALYEEEGNFTFGSDTQDYVFLLSLNEAALYFDNDSDRVLPEKVIGASEESGSFYSSEWWLRNGMAAAFCVGEDGQIDSSRYYNTLSVRPAIYVPVLTGEAREAALSSIYDEACDLFEKDTLEELERAQKLFKTILSYKDSENRLETLEEKKTEAVYNKACELAESDTIEELEEAQEFFEGILSYKDSESRLEVLKGRMEDVRLKAVDDKIRDFVRTLAREFTRELTNFDTLEDLEAYEQSFENISDIITYEGGESWLGMLKDELEYARMIAADDETGELTEGDALEELNETYAQLLESIINITTYEDSESRLDILKDKVQDAVFRALYDEACELAGKDTLEEPTAAYMLFEIITTYEDSESRLETLEEKYVEFIYNKACEFAESNTTKKLELAQEMFEGIDPYKDSESRLETIEEKLTELRRKADYDKACVLADLDTFEELKEAQELFEGITPYEDSESKLAMVKGKIHDLMGDYLKPLKNASVGDQFQFGVYDQNGTDDAISWRILAKEDDRVLLISDTVLEVKLYHDTDEETTWAECSLRRWLNDEFLREAFTEEEQACILVTEITTESDPDYGTYGGEQTQDKVFLLSVDEAERYFADDEDRIVDDPTWHVEQNGAYLEDDSSVYWWLRSPGYDNYSASVVSSDGDITSESVITNNDCVRPALWIDLSYTEGIEELETDYAVFEEPYTN